MASTRTASTRSRTPQTIRPKVAGTSSMVEKSPGQFRRAEASTLMARERCSMRSLGIFPGLGEAAIASSLISAHQLALAQHMTLHGFEQGAAAGARRKVQHAIQ